MSEKKKAPYTPAEHKCQAPECLFTCNDSFTLKRHTDWKHPELAKTAEGK